MIRQEGFGLVLLMVVLAGGGALFLAVLGSQRPDRPVDLEIEARRRVEAVAAAAFELCLRDGAFPASLNAVSGHGGLAAGGPWSADPHGVGALLEYRVTGSPGQLEVRAVGPDGRARTADDIVAHRDGTLPGRAWTRRRLDMLRAAYLRSDLMGGLVTPAERAQLGVWMREYAAAQAGLAYASAAERGGLITQRDAAAANIATLRAAATLPALPATVTGAGGLLDAVGCPQWMAQDGYGRTLGIVEAVGFVCDGPDGMGGTDDDF